MPLITIVLARIGCAVLSMLPCRRPRAGAVDPHTEIDWNAEYWRLFHAHAEGPEPRSSA